MQHMGIIMWKVCGKNNSDVLPEPARGQETTTNKIIKNVFQMGEENFRKR